MAACGAALAVSLIPAGCGSGSGPGGLETITGVEQLGWDQPAEGLAALHLLRFALYIDNVRVPTPEVTCGTTVGTAGFPCACSLPTMTAGIHTLQVSAYINDGATTLESERSVVLRVLKR
jgi:hypothetical protein